MFETIFIRYKWTKWPWYADIACEADSALESWSTAGPASASAADSAGPVVNPAADPASKLGRCSSIMRRPRAAAAAVDGRSRRSMGR